MQGRTEQGQSARAAWDARRTGAGTANEKAPLPKERQEGRRSSCLKSLSRKRNIMQFNNLAIGYIKNRKRSGEVMRHE